MSPVQVARGCHLDSKLEETVVEAAFITLLVLSGSIFVVGMIGGYIPLYREWSGDKLSLMIAFGGGTLFAAALFLMLPEGWEHIEEGLPWADVEAGFVAAAAITVGFLAMYLLENLALPHLGHDHEEHLGHSGAAHAAESASDRAVHQVGGLSAFVALSMHTLIDGIALGTAVAGGDGIAFGGLVFVAIIFHKMPAAFSLTSALKADHYPNRTSLIYLTIFNAMVPVGAVLAFLVLFGLPVWLLGAMLCFSAGTFIHVATSDLLPVIHRQHRGKVLLSAVVILGVLFMAGFGWIGVG
jgi:zinc and cadmium transporter